MKSVISKFLWEKSNMKNNGIKIKFALSRYCYIKPTSCNTWDNLYRRDYYDKPYKSYYVCTEKMFFWLWFRIILKVENEFISEQNREYSAYDMVRAAKYGYEFRDTTSFPEHKFEDSCINNTKQWIESLYDDQETKQ